VKTSFRSPSGDLSEVSLSRGYLAVVDLFLARAMTRWGAVLGRLLTPLADAFRGINDLAALRGAAATIGVYRARAATTPLRPWAFVVVTPAPGRSCND
jgi:hypothetical protein